MAEENKTPAAPEQASQGAQFRVQRIYTRDTSFETPNSPAIFQNEWKQEVKHNIYTHTNEIKTNL